MNCDVCNHQPVTAYSAEDRDGKMQELHLCEACARDMHCHACNLRPATVFLTQIVDGVANNQKFCWKCADEHGLLEPPAENPLQSLLSESAP